MKIIVLNGSPKGNRLSVTNLHVEFLKQQFKAHQFHTIPIAKQIKQIQKDDALFQSIVEEMKSADLIIWAFPVYFYLVPAQVKQFIEMLYTHVPKNAFFNKYVTYVSTSALTFDDPAYDYIRAVSEDYKMICLPGFAFDTIIKKQLLEKDIQAGFIGGFKNILRMMDEHILPPVQNHQLTWFDRTFQPPELTSTIPKSEENNIVIVTDGERGSNLDKMIQLFVAHSRYRCEIININDVNIVSGCTGCLQCQYQPKCAFNDDLNDLYLDRIHHATCMILAGTISDHHLSAKLKLFIDRGFFVAQRPRTNTGYISFFVSGPLRQRPLARQFLEIFASTRFLTQLGVITDEYTDDGYLSDLIINHAKTVDHYLAHQIRKPAPFYSRVYHLVMRDMLTVHTSVKQGPYKHYLKNGRLDYPNKNARVLLRGAANNIVFSLPFVRKKLQRNVLKLYYGYFAKLLK